MANTHERTLPVPGRQMAELDFFRGAWDADGVFHATPFSARKPIRMTIEVAPMHRGFWLRFDTAELADPDNPNPLTATYVLGYDPVAAVFVASWFDSNGGHAAQRSAGWREDRLTFEGVMTTAGFAFQLRDTFIRRGDEEYHHLGEVDLGQGWIPVDEETVRRRRVPPVSGR